LKDLEEEYAKCEIIKGNPVVTYKETVTDESSQMCLSKSPNKHNRLYCKASPLSDELSLLIETEKCGPKTEVKERGKILSEQFGYDYRKKFETNPNIFYEKFISNMTLASCMDYVVPMKMTSTQGASLLKDKSLKFCFIDANHTYNSVIEDINAYKPKIIDGCIMAGHDYYWDGVKKAVDESFKNINVMGTSWWTVIN
jgi:translation elongation factor EF-G